MQKRGLALFSVLVLLVLTNLSLSQEMNPEDVQATKESFDLLQEAVDENADAELSDGGIGPGSALYFVDEVFDNFASDESVKEEKAGEVISALESGDKESARRALERYEKYYQKVIENADPEKRENLRRSSAAVYNRYNEIERELSEEDKEEFGIILEKESETLIAVEISSKIKALCEQLASLDPGEYSRVCGIKEDEDAPDWRRRLDSDLTEQQREEAREFGGIMEQCFKTQGRECKCDNIPFPDFAAMCSVAAPLATACDEGNEEACTQLDELEMPELPDYLQDVMDDIERGVGDAQREFHLPPECREAGATNPDECRKIMIQTHAPEECRQHLLDANVKNEREARELCEKIMFELNAPTECIDAGIQNPKECGKFMFRQNVPQECIDAGLDGSSRDDPRKCEEIMRKFEGGFDRSGPNRGQGFGFDCRRIEDSEERLKCYDGAVQGIPSEFENRGPQGGWPHQCEQAGATTRENCERVMREWGAQQREFGEGRGEFREGEFRGDDFRGSPEECTGLSPEECASRFPQESPQGEFREGEFQEPEREEITEVERIESENSGGGENSGEGKAPITGEVVFSGNGFLKYYFR